jgi:alpha,alpha-trehalase
VPNGGRVYYLSRSQPPLLTPMVYEYFLATGDLQFVEQVLSQIENNKSIAKKHQKFSIFHRCFQRWRKSNVFGI